MTPQEQPDSQAGDELFESYQELQNIYLKWHDGKRPLSGFINELHAYAERLATKARLDEQQNLGFDKRLDNPILYCGGDSAISQEERIAELKATLTKGVDHDR